MMDPEEGDLHQHMFTNENKLVGIDGKPIDDSNKNSKWSHVFYSITRNWPKFKDKIEKRKIERVEEEMNMSRKKITFAGDSSPISKNQEG
jgi:hypothetical protein